MQGKHNFPLVKRLTECFLACVRSVWAGAMPALAISLPIQLSRVSGWEINVLCVCVCVHWQAAGKVLIQPATKLGAGALQGCAALSFEFWANALKASKYFRRSAAPFLAGSIKPSNSPSVCGHLSRFLLRFRIILLVLAIWCGCPPFECLAEV